MGKGIKMNVAKKKNSGDKCFPISVLNKTDNGNLVCHGCRTEIQYVSSYTTRASKKPVAAYLKLWQEHEHLENCPYTTKVAVDTLVAESLAIENTNPIFDILPDGSYIFRMNILIDAQRALKDINEANGNFEQSAHLKKANNYIRTERQLASYFNSASGVAKLRALIQESSGIDELKDLIKIKYQDMIIDWNDFYYDDSRYHILYNRLIKKNLKHPIALNMTIKEDVIYKKDAKSFPWCIQGYSKVIKDDRKTTAYVPRMYLSTDGLASSIGPNDSILIVGTMWASEPKDLNSPFRNLNIGIHNKHQYKKEVDPSN